VGNETRATAKTLRVLAFLFGIVSLAACGSSSANPPPDALRSVNRCLSAHHLRVVPARHTYVARKGEPATKIVRYEVADYTHPAITLQTSPPSTQPPYPDHAALIAQFANTHDAEAYSAYWQRASHGSEPGAPRRRLAGSAASVAWVREATLWAPVKIVRACVKQLVYVGVLSRG
jgi:hypothetical protein